MEDEAIYQTYKDAPQLSAVLREISWTHNLTISSRSKTIEEREFSLRMSIKENFTFRELERQISSGYFERVMVGGLKLSTPLRVLKDDLSGSFIGSYVFWFLDLPEPYEQDLQAGWVRQMKECIIESGKDFIFIG